MADSTKLIKSIADLESALRYKDKALSDSVFFLAIAKAFEVALEYSWKYFRAEAIAAGFDVVAPRDAIKEAGVLNLIDDIEDWLRFLKIRNIAVHDYLGVKPEEYVAEAESLFRKLRALEKRLLTVRED